MEARFMIVGQKWRYARVGLKAGRLGRVTPYIPPEISLYKHHDRKDPWRYSHYGGHNAKDFD
jgi:hypothetical protein